VRAVLFEAPEQVRLIDDAPRPRARDGELLVRVTHAGLCGSNTGPYRGSGHWRRTPWPAPAGWQGHENVGVVAESPFPEWPAGTPVLAHPEDYLGFAEYIVARPDGLARLPEGCDDAAAYLVAQPLATVLRALSRTRPAINEVCAVLGQGPIGLIFTRALSAMGARRVIAIDRAAWRLHWSRRMGATDVVDASRADTTEAVAELTGGAMVDLCIEAAGTDDGLTTAAMLPRRQGRLLVFGVPYDTVTPFPWLSVTDREVEVTNTRNGSAAKAFFETAVALVAGEYAALKETVTPVLPFERAAEAFALYAYPCSAEAERAQSLKVALAL
jgi:threonine dehydrogenase-like Zn-dependent dehydrogenase